MNEQIKELAEQAEIKFEYHPQHQGVDTAVIIRADLQKFAELIVRECISALDKEVYIATREDGEQACHEVILLEHFGVTNE